MEGTTQEHPAAATPDWSTLDVDVRCPRCDYNLRMLAQPRCPECGLDFEWDHVIAAARAEIDCPLFEYHWRRKPVRSLIYTMWLSLQPWRLWRIVRMESTPRFGPLAALAVSAIAFVLSLFVLGVGVSVLPYMRLPFSYRATIRSVTQALADFSWLSIVAGLALPLIVMLGAVSVYRITLVRFRIKRTHLLRIAMLAWLGWITVYMLCCALQLFSMSVFAAMYGSTTWRNFEFFWQSANWLAGLGPCAAFALFFVSVWLGFSRYLRLRRAWHATTAAFLVVSTAMIVVCVTMWVWAPRRFPLQPQLILDHWIPGLHDWILRRLATAPW
ncbi:MAG: hypothetical protein HZB38_13225 [Planctomycetes bacterium]|nr:hypothetical protein [Planctomycetota bacterium]